MLDDDFFSIVFFLIPNMALVETLSMLWQPKL